MAEVEDNVEVVNEEVTIETPSTDWTIDQWDAWADSLPEGKIKTDYFDKKSRGENFEYSSMTGPSITVEFKPAKEDIRDIEQITTAPKAELKELPKLDVEEFDKDQIIKQDIADNLTKENYLDSLNAAKETIKDDPNYRQGLREEAVTPYEEEIRESPSGYISPMAGGIIPSKTKTVYPYEEFEEDAKIKIQQEFKLENPDSEVITLENIPEDQWKPIAVNLWVDNKTSKDFTKKQEEIFGKLEDETSSLFDPVKQLEYRKIRAEIDTEFTKKATEAQAELFEVQKQVDSNGEFITNGVSTLESLSKQLEVPLNNPTEAQIIERNNTIKEYNTLLNDLNLASVKYDVNLNELNEKIERGDFESYTEIADMAKMSFDMRESIMKKFGASAIDLVAGLGQVNATVRKQIYEVFDLEPGVIDMAAEVGLNKLYEASDYLRSTVKQRTSLDDIESFGDFVWFATDILSEQAVNTAVTASTGGLGLILISTSATGSKFHQMELEEKGAPQWNAELGKYEEVNYTPLQYLGSGLIAFGSEYLTEKVALDNFNSTLKLFRKGDFDIKGTKYSYDRYSVAEGARKYLTRSIGEGGAELGAEAGGNLGDIVVLGKDISMTQGLTEAFVTGFTMNALGFGAPVLVQDLYKAFTSNQDVKKYQRNGIEIKRLTDRIDQIAASGNITRDKYRAIKELKNASNLLLDENFRIKGATEARVDELNNHDKRELINIANKQHDIKVEVDRINKNPELLPEDKKAIIERNIKEFNKLEAVKENVMHNRTLNADIAREAKLENQKIIENNLGDELQTVVGENTTELKTKLMQLNNQMKKFKKQ